jgi:hypothetical protein
LAIHNVIQRTQSRPIAAQLRADAGHTQISSTGRSLTDDVLEKQQRAGEKIALLMEMSRQNLEKQARLLDHWEERLKRFDAILANWEQQE